MSLENYNYARDPRTQGPAKKPTLYMDDGTEVELPTKWAVCPVCDGKGTHVNPSIDAGGLSYERCHDDPEFLQDYFDGMYDQQCNRCQGRTTVPEVDWDQLTAEQKRLYNEQLEADAAYEAERLAEIRMGC